ncbi:hypothetical protein J7E29_09870 [Streptomyces sp. ISL-90]|nr:hypothetical protein [Streptomyces sp. ISL-90]
MTEKPIKVDAHTDRLVSDIAHFLGRSKKSVVRDAIHEFAEEHRLALGVGVADAVARASSATRNATGVPRSHGGGTPGAPEFRTLAELPLRDRLTIQRAALIAEFAKAGATEIRLIGGLAIGEDADEVELLVELDLSEGSAPISHLQHTAQQLLRAPVKVVSAPALELFDREGFERARVIAQAL